MNPDFSLAAFPGKGFLPMSTPRSISWFQIPWENSPRRGDPSPERGADSSFLRTQICTYFRQHKIQRDRMSHKCSSPDGDRTRGGRTGTGLGSCPSRSHTPCSTGDSVLLLCPQSSPEGTRSRTSCGSRRHRGPFQPSPPPPWKPTALLGPLQGT